MHASTHIADYCEDLFNYRRNPTRTVNIGQISMGSDHPIRIQSMTTTNTMDTLQTVQQSIRIIEAGGELVRVTTQGRSEAQNLKEIKEQLRAAGFQTPLVADIHFNPNAANIAAKLIEKVRVNPGNFTGGAKKYDFKNHSEQSYQEGLNQMEEKLIPFLNICKENNTAVRIGTNHGSLSDRIMSRYGDTPEGMVEACMEYLRICEANHFYSIVLSLKASNTRIMVHTVRLLVARMKQENMQYPLHLGVTEAGNEDEGRIKSAVGSGALLIDGLGDTIRISLTEAPEMEIPVARKLINHISKRAGHSEINPCNPQHYSPYNYQQRKTHSVLNIGGEHTAVVIASFKEELKALETSAYQPDYYFLSEDRQTTQINDQTPVILPYAEWRKTRRKNSYPLYQYTEISAETKLSFPAFMEVSYQDMAAGLPEFLHMNDQVILLLKSHHINLPVEQRATILELMNQNLTHPLILMNEYAENDMENFQIIAAADAGILFLDGLADGLLIKNTGTLASLEVIATQFGILQASRVRFTKTEFISCPGCGRTLFDLQATTKEVKRRTSHLKGLKIGIMGCIINGIGEMADADYGYIGSGPNTVSLFKKRTLVKRDIPNIEAVEELITLIKENNDWHDPDTNITP